MTKSKHYFGEECISYDSDNWYLCQNKIPDKNFIYSKSAIVEMINDGFQLGENESFIPTLHFK